MSLPAPGTVGGSHDSVLPKEGEVKARPLRQGTQGTSLSSSSLCSLPISPSPISPSSASSKAGQGPMHSLLVVLARSSTASLDLQHRPAALWTTLSGCHSPQPEAGEAAIRRGCGSRMGRPLVARVEPPAPARETLPAAAQPFPALPFSLASHISASELLAPPCAAVLLRPLHQTDVNPPCAGSGLPGKAAGAQGPRG